MAHPLGPQSGRQSEWHTRWGHSQAVTYTQFSTKLTERALCTLYTACKEWILFQEKRGKENSPVTQPASQPRVHKHSPDPEALLAITGIHMITLFPSSRLESKQGTCAESSGQCVACGKCHCLCSSPCCRLAVPGSLRPADRQDFP